MKGIDGTEFYAADINVGPRKTFKERKKQLLEDLSNEPNSLMGRIRDPKTSREDQQTYEKFLMESIAETVGAEAYERFKGKLPKGVTEETFSRRLANDPSFKNMVTPLISSVYWAVGKADKETPGLGKKAANIVVELIEDKTFLTACNLDQMYQNELEKNKNNPQYNVTGESPGVSKIKTSYQKKILNAQAELTHQKTGPRR